MDYKITRSHKYVDSRGYLVEFLKNCELNGEDRSFGQIYFVTFEKQFQVRGNHYHTRFSEWFGVAHGTLRVVLEDVRTKENVSFVLSAEDKSFIRLNIGPYVAHAFQNLSPTAVLLDYCNKEYNTENPDRNPYVLIDPSAVIHA